LVITASAAQVPAGTELHVRLPAKISSADAKPGGPVNAVLIAPVVVNGTIVIPPGAELSGTVKSAQPAATDRSKPPTLDLEFKRLSFEAEQDAISVRVVAVDNAKEKVDDNGVITGIPASQTYTARMNRGIEKMSGSDRFSGLAGILEGVKKAIVTDADPDITFEAGTELLLKTTAALNVAHPSAGIAGDVRGITDESGVMQMVRNMPLRASATNGRPSDLTNLLFVGTQEQLTAAFEAAGWSTAAQLSRQSKFETAKAMIEQRGYKEAPVSVLLVDGRPPELVYQKQNNTFDSRHHLRIWSQKGTWDGRPVWICAATHDVGISYSEREGTFIHRIDPNVDDERAKVVNDLIFARKVAALALVQRDTVPRDAENATGDPLHTDGQLAVLVLK
jgi:hypothetical protein